MRATLVCLVLIAFAGPAVAHSIYCSRFETIRGELKRPSPPDCLDGSTSLKDKNAFERCREQVEAYDRSVGEYLLCLRDEIGDTEPERKKADDHLRCYAGGIVTCF